MLARKMAFINNPETEAKKASHPDLKFDLVVSEDAEVFIFHDQPFDKKLGWLEYNLDTKNLDFVLDGGGVRDFGVTIPDHLVKHMQNAYQVMVVLKDDKGEPVSGDYYPIILHRPH